MSSVPFLPWRTATPVLFSVFQPLADSVLTPLFTYTLASLKERLQSTGVRIWKTTLEILQEKAAIISVTCFIAWCCLGFKITAELTALYILSQMAYNAGTHENVQKIVKQKDKEKDVLKTALEKAVQETTEATHARQELAVKYEKLNKTYEDTNLRDFDLNSKIKDLETKLKQTETTIQILKFTIQNQQEEISQLGKETAVYRERWQSSNQRVHNMQTILDEDLRRKTSLKLMPTKSSTQIAEALLQRLSLDGSTVRGKS